MAIKGQRTAAGEETRKEILNAALTRSVRVRWRERPT